MGVQGLTFEALVRKLLSEGWELHRGNGARRIYRHPRALAGEVIVLHYHRTSHVPAGTLHQILKVGDRVAMRIAASNRVVDHKPDLPL